MAQEIDRSRRHDIDAIDRGLTYLARCYGKARRASRLMADDGLEPIPPATLDYWKKVAHTGRYEHLRAEWEKRRDLEAAERMDGLVSRTLDLEEKILEQAEEKLDEIDARDLPNAYKNLAIGSGVLQDKSDKIKGRPAEVVHHQIDLTTVRQAIARLEAQQLEAKISDGE